VRYCTSCVIPSTRPHIVFDERGVCNACLAHGSKETIDWPARRQGFRDLVTGVHQRQSRYDCLVPVSGGKDSTWQIVTCLEHDLRPLAVTWKTPGRTLLGEKNLANLVSLGVDHIDYQINPKVERRFMLKALEKYGSSAIPMHLALFNIPLKVAAAFRIPLVVWGENSAFEYGSEAEFRHGFRLNRAWLNRFGVTHGTTAADWVSAEFSEADLAAYFGPSDEELESAGVAAVFLGYYFGWDPEKSLSVASDHGFQRRAEGPKVGLWDYADIDDDFISIHHYLKWFKFGFTRSFDNLSVEIRNGRMTRAQAVEWLEARGDETPVEDIARFCEFVGVSQERFFTIIERFRNPQVWTRRDGRWVIDGFICPARHWL